MSLEIHKWMSKYLTGIAIEYGALDSRIAPTKTKQKCQIVKFLTHLSEIKTAAVEADNCIWAMLSDKQHQIPTRFTAQALAEFANDPSYRGKRFTECTGAIIIISDFTPCFRRVPIREGDALSKEATISLDVQTFKLKGSVGEGIWGKPQALAKNLNLQEWMLEMAKPNGDVNVLKNRDKGVEMKPVHKPIKDFDAFPVRIATPPAPEVALEPPNKPNTKPKAERSLDKCYNKKWKKLLGEARKSHENACIPAHVKAQFCKPDPHTSIVFTNRNALNFNLSQATCRSTSPPHTPELIPTTPPIEEWPNTQSEGDREEDISDRELSPIDSSPAKNWDTDPEDEEDIPNASPPKLKFEMPSLSARLPSTSTAQWQIDHPAEQAKEIASSSGPNGEFTPDDYISATASSGFIFSLEASLPQPEVFKDQTNSNESKQTRYHEANATFSLPPPTPAQRVASQVTSSKDIEWTLPSSSLSLPSTLNRNTESNPPASPVAGPSRYADQVERKVAMPKQGPPMVAQQAKGPDGKTFTIFVPASDTSVSMSQSQPQAPSQSQPKSQKKSELSVAVIPEETDPAPVAESVPVMGGSTDTSAIIEKPSSVPPVAFLDVESSQEVSDNHVSASDEDELDEDDAILAKKLIHSSQVLKSPKRSSSPISEPSTRLSAIAKGKMREEPQPSRKLARKRSPSLQTEAVLPKSNSSRKLVLTHDAEAWREPSFQARSAMHSKGAEREVEANKVLASKVNPVKNPVLRDPEPRAKPKDPPITTTIGRKRTITEMDPEETVVTVVSKKRRSARAEILARHISSGSIKDQAQVPASDVSREITRPRMNLGGFKISLEVDPIEGITLFTHKSLAEVLLQTGRIRYKMTRKNSERGS